MGDVLAYSSAMRRLAVEVGKVASDLRLLSMGPRAGIAEIALAGRATRFVDHAGQGESVDAGDGEPGLLPGDRDATRPWRSACEAGQLELNVMMPVIAWNAIHSRRSSPAPSTGSARCAWKALPPTRHAATSCSTAQRRQRHGAQPAIGYARTAEIAKESIETGRPIGELVLARGLLDEKKLDEILSVDAMTRGA